MNKMQTEPIAAAEAAEAPRTGRLRNADGARNWTRTILMLIVPALLVIGGAYMWLTSGGSVSTDDAQVKQDIVSVSPQVNGQIVQVFVRNGSRVRRGDILFKIDPQPYRVAVEQAEAQLASAQLQTHVLKTTAAGTGGDIIGAEANLKEKDVGRMVPGERATIQVDAYGGQKFEGHVQSIGAGTGSQFSLLPAQNANGNWVKVTQRVPVRIAFNGTPDRPMIAGLSVTARVYFDQPKK